MAEKKGDFDPILLPTGYDDILEACRAAKASMGCIPEGLVMRLEEIVGAHRCCGGTVRLQKRSGTHNVLHCPNCSMTLTIPISVKTYGQLRDWCSGKLLVLGGRQKGTKNGDSILA